MLCIVQLLENWWSMFGLTQKVKNFIKWFLTSMMTVASNFDLLLVPFDLIPYSKGVITWRISFQAEVLWRLNGEFQPGSSAKFLYWRQFVSFNIPSLCLPKLTFQPGLGLSAWTEIQPRLIIVSITLLKLTKTHCKASVKHYWKFLFIKSDVVEGGSEIKVELSHHL